MVPRKRKVMHVVVVYFLRKKWSSVWLIVGKISDCCLGDPGSIPYRTYL
jgi:hypothetical protein